jgi:hypothetical protein
MSFTYLTISSSLGKVWSEDPQAGFTECFPAVLAPIS